MTGDDVGAVLRFEGVDVRYRARRGGQPGHLHAVQGVSLSVEQGQVVGIVGESGSGKSSLARVAVGVTPPAAGRVLFRGRDLAELRRDRPLAAARCVQMVFQDAGGALDPRQSAGAALEEVLRLHGAADDAEIDRRVGTLLESVGLSDVYRTRLPHELSGGQRQRLGVARALAVEPEVLILDEPVSALDVSVQAQILRLLEDLRNRFHLSIVLIAHDLAVVRNVCDRVAVMFQGRIVEESDTTAVFDRPLHPYTVDLLGAVPRIGRRATPSEIAAPGASVADIGNVHTGCAYFTRCRHPDRDDTCAAVPPVLGEHEPGHGVACTKVGSTRWRGLDTES